MMLYGVLVFLAVSLLFYVLFAGADFGAGILELFIRAEKKAQQQLITHAIAPVWEANHIWIILAVVILFMGFPTVYANLSIYLHLPLVAILVGIVARGAAFTFRHYDTHTPRFYGIYSRVFSWSSLWTAFFLGVFVGALFLGKISPDAADYATLYLHPWLNLFCAAVGLFVVHLFAFLAAVYLVGEAEDPRLREIFLRKAAWANLGLVLVGALVFLTAERSNFSLFTHFFRQKFSVACFILATILLVPFWRGLRRGSSTLLLRANGIVLVSLVLFGGFAVQFPSLYRFTTTSGLVGSVTFSSAAAPDNTLRALLGALVFGSLLIFPALAYLFQIFKRGTLK